MSAHLTDLLPESVTSCAADAAKVVDVERRSLYVPAADGTRLAVDVFLPKGKEPPERRPTLFKATRYWRGRKDEPIDSVQRQWVERGYAVVALDVRGTGASFGQWYVPYSTQEARDIGLVAAWIASQPWSNGRVVMTGNSYPGTTPLMAPAYANGTVRAVAPKFSDFDIYTDLLFPGGVATEALSLDWGRLVRGLDLNRAPEGGAGVRPVDGADGEALLAAAIKEHALNPHGFEGVPYLVTYKDQPISDYHGMALEDSGIYKLGNAVERSGVPIFGWGSWLDSGIAQGLLNRFMTWSNPQLTVIGPWMHGAKQDVNVFSAGEALDPSGPVQDRLVFCFLDHYAQADAPSPIAANTLFYFTMGENRWKSTHVWPIPGTQHRRYYLDAGHALSPDVPARAGEDTYKVDFEASAGPANRWATQADGPRIDYGDRSEADSKLLVYTGAPLPRDLELTGQAVMTLRVASSASDGSFFVYLEDVAASGRVTYLSEGVLRGIHRKLSRGRPPYRTTYPDHTFQMRDGEPLIPGEAAALTFQLQATSVLIRAGHRIRVAIAGADKGTFLRIPSSATGDVAIKVARGAGGSYIELPVVPH